MASFSIRWLPGREANGPPEPIHVDQCNGGDSRCELCRSWSVYSGRGSISRGTVFWLGSALANRAYQHQKTTHTAGPSDIPSCRRRISAPTTSSSPVHTISPLDGWRTVSLETLL